MEDSDRQRCHRTARCCGGSQYARYHLLRAQRGDSCQSRRGRNLYDIAFDPANPNRIAVAGWGFGVALSEDGGKRWQFRNSGLPRTDVWSVGFDPGNPGRLYASVHEEAVYVSGDGGAFWIKD